MKYCPNCGKELFDEAVMCPGCKASFVKKFRLTVFHREQALPLINPAIKSEIDGLPPIPVKKGDSIVYELDEGMHFVKLTGQGRNNQLDINLNCDLMIMVEWNAATGGIDYRISQGQIQGSLPINFQESAPVSSPQADEATEIVPENTKVNEALPETENAVPLAGNEIPVGEYYQPAENAYQATGNNENINQPEAEENSLQVQTAFCKMCGNPIPLGEKLCTDCVNKQNQSAPNQMPVILTPKKERNPLSKKAKALIISLIAVVLATLLAFGGFKVYQYIEKKQIEAVTNDVQSRIENLDICEYSNTDSDGNVTVLYPSRSGDTSGNLYLLKLYLNTETGKLADSVDVTDSMQFLFASEHWIYYYDKENSYISLFDDELNPIGKMQVELDDDKKIKAFVYDDIKYEKTDEKTAELVKECYDFIKREGTVLNNADKYETKLRATRWDYSYSSILMGDLIDTCFENYTFSVHADRNDENKVHLYINGDLNPYVYCCSNDYTMKIDYSISDNEFTIVDDTVEGGYFTLRDMYFSYKYL